MKQIIPATVSSSPSQTDTQYYNIFTEATSWSNTEAEKQMLFPTAGIIDNFMFLGSTGPGTAPNAYTYTIMKNGVATTLSGSVTGSNVGFIDHGEVVHVAAGDTISIRAIPNDTPTQPGNAWTTMMFHPTTAQRFALPGGNGNNDLVTTGSVNYAELQGSTYSTNATIVNSLVPIDATIKSFYVKLTVAPGAGTSYEFSIYKNNSKEASSVVTIADSATTGNATGLSIDVAPGDVLKIAHVSSGAVATSRAIWGVEFQPDNDGQYFYHQDNRLTSLDTSNRFNTPHAGSALGYFTSESTRFGQVGWHHLKFSNLYVVLDTAPGVGTDRTFTLRKDAVNTALAVTIADANTTGNDTDSVIFDQLDFMSIGATTATAPAATTLRTGVAVEVMNAPEINDTVTVNEELLWNIVSYPSVVDTITITESVTIFLPTLKFSVSDTVTITENLTFFNSHRNVTVFDTVTITEVATILHPLLRIEIFDSVAVTDSYAMFMQDFNLFMTDFVHVTDVFDADPFGIGYDPPIYKPVGTSGEDTGISWAGQTQVDY